VSRQKINLNSFDEIFVDGSAYQNKKLYGIGGLVICHNNLRLCKEFKAQLFGRHDSQTAEIYSVVYGLNSLPENSRVVVHNDLQKLCDKMNGGLKSIKHWFNKEAKNGKKHAEVACKDLLDAMKRHDTIVAMFERKSDRHFMKKAHDLAQEGATGELQTQQLLVEPTPPSDLKGHMKYKSYESRKTYKGNRSRRERKAIDNSIGMDDDFNHS